MRETLIAKVYGGFQGENGNIVIEDTERQSVVELWVGYLHPQYLRFESNRLRVILQIVFSWEIFRIFFLL